LKDVFEAGEAGFAPQQLRKQFFNGLLGWVPNIDLKVLPIMKTDIITLVILVFCVGVLVSALDLGSLFDAEEAPSTGVVLQQSSDKRLP